MQCLGVDIALPSLCTQCCCPSLYVVLLGFSCAVPVAAACYSAQVIVCIGYSCCRSSIDGSGFCKELAPVVIRAVGKFGYSVVWNFLPDSSITLLTHKIPHLPSTTKYWKMAFGMASNLFHLCRISWLTDAQFIYEEASVQTDGNFTAHLQWLPTPPEGYFVAHCCCSTVWCGRRGRLRTYLLIKEMPPSPKLGKAAKLLCTWIITRH